MYSNIYKSVIKESKLGFAHHKIILDSDGKPIDYVFLEVNSAFEEITGLKEKNIIGKPITEVVPGILTESFNWISYYGEIALNGKMSEFEQFFEHLGKWFNIQTFSNEKLYFSTLFSDISTQYFMSEIAQNFLNYTPRSVDYQFIVDKAREIVGASYTVLNIFEPNGKEFMTVAASGINKKALRISSRYGVNFVGKKWPYDPKREAKIKDNKTTLFQDLNELTGYVIPTKIINTLSRIFNIGKVAIVKTEKNGTILGDFTFLFERDHDMINNHLIDTYADMTGLLIDKMHYELKIEEDKIQLSQEKEKAEESDKLKSAFLANMSHEIRTPMNSIIGFSNLLAENELSIEDSKNFAKYINHSGNHLLNLINDIVDISKIDAGQMKPFIEATDINYLLQELKEIYQSQVKANVQIITLFSQKSFCVETDRTRLRQILINLISNAMKFTDNGSITVGYSIKQHEILFYVKDTGTGIPKEKFDTVFERFQQANANTEKLYGGTGLGLAIAKACTEMLGGNIWIDSKLGKGTTFYFTIKKVECTTTEFDFQNSEQVSVMFNGEHILIAEDDDLNYLYLSEILHPYNLTLSRTIDGEETFQKINNSSDIDLVLMDINMPTMSGFEVTKKLRTQNNNIPIIAQTAYAFEEDRQKSLNAGCDEYISKPINRDELIALIHKFLVKES